MIKTLNDGLQDRALVAARLERAFELNWPRLKTKLENAATVAIAPVVLRSNEEKIEELLTLARGLQAQVDSLTTVIRSPKVTNLGLGLLGTPPDAEQPIHTFSSPLDILSGKVQRSGTRPQRLREQTSRPQQKPNK